MIDFHTAKMRGHRRNIARYSRLLATELTDLERQYLHKRIAEEHAQLERLKKSEEKQHAEVRPISTDEHCDMIGAGE
jgi:5-bromo-4-chloroindolyl phosphate hydrolysis protein